MNNRYITGEQIIFGGILKDKSTTPPTVTTDYTAVLQVARNSGHTLLEFTMTVDTENHTYNYVWDTTGYRGEFLIRAVIKNAQGTPVVSNNFVPILIER